MQTVQPPTAKSHHDWGVIAPNRDALGVGERQLGSAEATAAIRALAEQQHGVVARSQLLGHGLSAELVKGRLASGHLIPIYEGVFAVGQRRVGRYGKWMAAVLACGPNAVLSHGSAAELWSIRRSRGLPEVTRRSGGSRRPGVRLHQTRVLESAEVTVESGIPVTSIERTLLDIAGRLDLRQLEHAIVTADRTGRLSWPEFHRLMVRTPSRKGAGRLRRVAGQVNPVAIEARSPLEVDFLALCREAGLPVPAVNVLVEGYLVDFSWPAQRLVVEMDSYTYHSDRPAFERDHERTVALEACGHKVHRATRGMLESNPGQFIDLVRRSLAQRGASRLGAISTK